MGSRLSLREEGEEPLSAPLCLHWAWYSNCGEGVQKEKEFLFCDCDPGKSFELH